MRTKGGRRLLEAGKTLLILLLALSALYLFGRTQLFNEVDQAGQGWVSGLIGLFGGQGGNLPGGVAEAGQTAVVRPARVAVMNERGRYGGQYDSGIVDELYSKTPNLLADALAGAGTPRQVPVSAWNDALSRQVPGFYLDFLGRVPFSVLAASVGGGESSTGLTDEARRLLLTTDSQGGAVLYYNNETDSSYYACEVSGGRELATRMADAVEEYSPNGMLFAFEDAQRYSDLDPYTLIKQDDTPAPLSYLASGPVPIYDNDAVDQLMRDLSFHPQSSQAVRSSNGLSIREGSNDSLRIYDTGVVIYHAAIPEDSRFPLSGAETPTVLELIEGAWTLVEQSAGSRCGEARIYLIGMDRDGDSTVLYFGYQLSGADVVVRDDGYAAKVVVQGRSIVDFTLQLRNYKTAAETTPVLPVIQAAAAMRALEVRGSELLLSYLDQGANNIVVGAQWVAR